MEGTAEVPLYDGKGVYISNKRVIFDDNQYSLTDIASALVAGPHMNIRPSFYLIVVGLGLLVYLGSQWGGFGLCGLLLAGVGVLLIVRTKKTYALHISTRTGKSRVLMFDDRSQADAIAQGINIAIRNDTMGTEDS
jgi:hypothetical protein